METQTSASGAAAPAAKQAKRVREAPARDYGEDGTALKRARRLAAESEQRKLKEARERAHQAEALEYQRRCCEIASMLHEISKPEKQRIMDGLVQIALSRVDARTGECWEVLDMRRRDAPAAPLREVVEEIMANAFGRGPQRAGLDEELEQLSVQFYPAPGGKDGEGAIGLVLLIEHILKTCRYDPNAGLTLYLNETGDVLMARDDAPTLAASS